MVRVATDMGCECRVGWFRGWALVIALVLVLPLPGGAQSQSNDPVLVAAVLDTSGSLGNDDLELVRTIVPDLLGHLPGGSQIAVFTFADEVQLRVAPTADQGTLRSSLLRLHQEGKHTRLYEALYRAIEYLERSTKQRRALLVISDGMAENSALLADDVIDAATESRVPILAIGIGKMREENEQGMKRLSWLTKGDFFTGSDADATQVSYRIRDLALAASTGRETSEQRATKYKERKVGGEGGPGNGGPVEGESGVLVSGSWLRMALYILILLVIGAVIVALILHFGRPRNAATNGAATEATSKGVQDAQGFVGSIMLNRNPGGVERVAMVCEETTKLTTFIDVAWIITERCGSEIGKSFEIRNGSKILLGRKATCDLLLSDDAVSAEHCALQSDGKGLFVIDLNSTNGTLVNNNKVKEKQLENGDVIKLGHTELAVSKVGYDDPPSLPVHH